MSPAKAPSTPRLHRRFAPLVISALSLIYAPLSSAATIGYGPFTIADQSTDWTDTMPITQFDPSLGTLTAISFTLSATVSGSARAESLDASESVATTNLSAQVVLQDPTGSALVTSIPVSQQLDNLSAFDTVIDFGGTSGITHPTLQASDTMMGVSTDFALFTGLGTVDLPVVAEANSTASGPGNIVSQFVTSAEASVSVTYTYEVIPEPSSALLLLLGTLAMGCRRRRCKSTN